MKQDKYEAAKKEFDNGVRDALFAESANCVDGHDPTAFFADGFECGKALRVLLDSTRSRSLINNGIQPIDAIGSKESSNCAESDKEQEIVKVRGLTRKEKNTLEHLTNFWNAYISLPRSSDAETRQVICDAIHVIQGVMAIRVARRLNPEFWV